MRNTRITLFVLVLILGTGLVSGSSLLSDSKEYED